jgi:ATP-dependent Clp endopeptidase proteolytic subunit ClpP
MKLLEIQNRAGKLKLNDGVYKESADKLIEELDALYGASAVVAKMVIGEAVCKADDALESVEVEINSPGGSVFEGQRIYNALRGISARGVEVITTVNGLAASMGSVILMAGDKRLMTQGSRVMIHEASTFAWGDARALRKNADMLEGISAEIAGIYAERTGGDEKKIRNLMFAETWMTADEAKENGFIDTVLKDGKPKDEFDTIPKASMSILDKLLPNAELASKIEAKDSEIKSLEASISEVSAKFAMIENELQNAITELTAVKADLDEKTEALKVAEEKITEQEGSITELAEKSEASAEKISLEASRLLAATGHPTPVAEIADDATAQVDHFAIMSKLSPEDRSDYYTKNRSKILSL